MDIKPVMFGKYFPSAASWLIILIVALTEALAAKEDWGLTKYDVKKLSYTWKIENYSHNGKAFKEKLLSPRFYGNDSKDYQWQMLLYPRGDFESSKQNVGLYMSLVKKKGVKAYFTFHLIDKNGKKAKSLSMFQIIKTDSWGFASFISQNELENTKKADYLPNDTLTLMVEITFSPGMIRVSNKCSTINTEECTSLPFNSSFMGDIDLYVEDQYIKAHKAGLIAHSSWLKSELELWPNAESITLPPNFKADVIKEALKFIYTGKIQANEAMFKKLLALSDRLGMRKLKLYCEQALCKSMTLRTASGMLDLAEIYNADNLKREAENFILGIDEGATK